jgi:hypothetical protein
MASSPSFPNELNLIEINCVFRLLDVVYNGF